MLPKLHKSKRINETIQKEQQRNRENWLNQIKNKKASTAYHRLQFYKNVSAKISN